VTPAGKYGPLERRTLWAAGVLGAIGAATAFLEPRAAALGYRFAMFACMAAPVGCLILILLHRIVGGQWATDLAAYLRAGAALLPWIWLLAFPLLAIPASGPDGVPRAPRHGYESVPMEAVRACAYAVIFFGFRWAVGDDIGRERDPMRNQRPWVGPAGLIVLVFMLTFLADDWLESLEAGWHSTAFPVVWMTGQVVTGLSLCLLGALWQGSKPDAIGSASRPVGRDWGNLLLTGTVFWTYLAFAQFLIIWAGNLPEEISWFLHRENGVWPYVIPGVAVLGFAAPFFMLLSRRLKTSVAGLACTAVMLLVAQLGYLAWVVLPAGGPISVRGSVVVATIFGAGVALFINRFAHGARLARRGAP
jgi:hypothetical protein